MTLEDLLREKLREIDGEPCPEYTPDFRVSVQKELAYGIHFIIHANGHNSETLDFVVKGNKLVPLPGTIAAVGETKADPNGNVNAPWTPDQLTAINEWQSDERFHPLTCGEEGCDGELYADRHYLFCPSETCDYKQTWVPKCIFDIPLSFKIPNWQP